MLGAETTGTRSAWAALALYVLTGLSDARAEVRLSTEGATVRMEARAAPLSEVLSALQTRFRLRYRIATEFTDTIDGSFAGSIDQVIGRALARVNYVIKRDDDTLEVIVLGPRGDRAVAAPSGPAPVGPADAWRRKPMPNATSPIVTR